MRIVVHDQDVELEVLRRSLVVFWSFLIHPDQFESLLREFCILDMLDADYLSVLFLHLFDVEFKEI